MGPSGASLDGALVCAKEIGEVYAFPIRATA